MEIQTGDRRLTSLGECAEAFVTILLIFSPFLYKTFKHWAFNLQLKKYMLKTNIQIVWKHLFNPKLKRPFSQKSPQMWACSGFLPVMQIEKKKKNYSQNDWKSNSINKISEMQCLLGKVMDK